MNLTEDQARKIFLKQDGASEGEHHGHPDFRIHNKVFATLQPSKGVAVFRLPMEFAESEAKEKPDRCRVASRASGMGWLGIELASWKVNEIKPLAEVAASLVRKK